jgi:hypothetical protein
VGILKVARGIFKEVLLKVASRHLTRMGRRHRGMEQAPRLQWSPMRLPPDLPPIKAPLPRRPEAHPRTQVRRDPRQALTPRGER